MPSGMLALPFRIHRIVPYRYNLVVPYKYHRVRRVGVDYRNERVCQLCKSVDEKDGVFHFLCMCVNPGLSAKRHELYEVIKQALCVESLVSVCVFAG